MNNRILLLEKKNSVQTLPFLILAILIAFSIFAEEVCKFEYMDIPEQLDGKTIQLPHSLLERQRHTGFQSRVNPEVAQGIPVPHRYAKPGDWSPRPLIQGLPIISPPPAVQFQ